jgi:hypothetical protein
MPSTYGAFGAPRPAPRPAVIEPDMDDEDGVAYVSNLVISGTTVTGGTLTTSGEFVGTPTVQWFRVDSKGAKTEIDGAATLSYSPTIDDVGCTLRCECTGPYGGDPVGVASAPIAMEPSIAADLQKLLAKKSAEKEYKVQDANQPRTLLIARDKIKLRKGSSSLWKHDYVKGLSVTLESYDETTFTLQLDPAGANNCTLSAENRNARDAIAFILRQLAPRGFDNVSAGSSSRRSEDNGSVASSDISDEQDGEGKERNSLDPVAEGDDEGYSDNAKKKPSGFGDFGDAGAGGDGDEAGGEEGDEAEEFKPAIKVKIRDPSQIVAPSGAALRSLSLSAPPPPGSGRRRSSTMASPAPARSALEDARLAAAAHEAKAANAGFDSSNGFGADFGDSSSGFGADFGSAPTPAPAPEPIRPGPHPSLLAARAEDKARIDRDLERAHAHLKFRTLILELCDLRAAAHHFGQALLGQLLGALGLAQPLVAHLALPLRQLILELLPLQEQLSALLGDTHLEELALHRRSACRHLQLLLLGTRERRVPLQCRHLRVQARRSALGGMQLLTDHLGGRTGRHERLRLCLDLGALMLRLLDGANNLEIALARVRDERLMREAITCHQRPSGGALRGALRGTQRHSS